MTCLDKEDITFINQRTVAEHGGNFMPPYNFLHEENLDYLIEAVQAEMFGEPLYPTLTDKAAVYCSILFVITSSLMAINGLVWKRLLLF